MVLNIQITKLIPSDNHFTKLAHKLTCHAVMNVVITCVVRVCVYTCTLMCYKCQLAMHCHGNTYV